MLRRTRRAPKACSWCHHRKVRCDASIRGCPCTRCRQDGRPECVLRGKLPRNFGGFVVPQNADVDDPNHHNTTTRGRLESITASTNAQLEHIRSLIPDLDLRDTPSLPRGHVNYSVYKFLDFRGAATLPREDVAFLSSKGALAVPERALMNEFIRQYFLQIHPSMPVLDEAEIWDIYEQRDGETDAGRISLFVFQALLFSSCPYVSQETLQKCGFEDKRSARNTLFKRAKFLFDLQGEDRPFVLAQGSTLLSHHTSAEEPQAGSLWLTRAIQNAMIIGCQPGPSEDVELAGKKRLWWSIILRDRSLCLGLRRRPQVTTLDFGIAADLIEEADLADEIQFSRVYDPATKRLLLKVLQEQCRLAVMLTEMTALVFASHGLSSPSFSLEQYRESLATVSRIRASLQQWEACSQLATLLDAANNTPDAVTLFTNYTYMYYHTARIDLAHYEALLVENHLMFAGENYIKQVWETGNTLRDAMDRLIDIMEYFSREGRAQNLPLSLLAYVGMPLVLTAIDLKLSPSTSEMDVRRRRLDALGEIIRHSGRVYDVTDFVSAGTNHILQLAYMTAQHLFLRWDSDPASPPRAGSVSSQSGAAGQTDLVATSTQSAVTGRANSWFDAFLRYPRAYLLISTSVDYSLSVGRLPYDSALPELVRCIPPIGIGIRLPWTINNAVTAPPPRRRLSQMRRRDDRSPVKTLTPSSSTSVDLQPVPELHTQHDVPVQQDVPALNPVVVPEAAASGVPSEPREDPADVNLDYLYLDGMPVGSPDYGEPGMAHETEAERWQLRETTASFDPLISSWVQEFFGEGPPPQSPGRMEVDGAIILDH